MEVALSPADVAFDALLEATEGNPRQGKDLRESIAIGLGRQYGRTREALADLAAALFDDNAPAARAASANYQAAVDRRAELWELETLAAARFPSDTPGATSAAQYDAGKAVRREVEKLRTDLRRSGVITPVPKVAAPRAELADDSPAAHLARAIVVHCTDTANLGDGNLMETVYGRGE